MPIETVEQLDSEEIVKYKKELEETKENFKKETELMKENVKEITDSIYDNASNISSNALYLIAHTDNRRKEYSDFAEAVKTADYKKAREIILTMLPKIDEYVNKYQARDNKVNFNSISDNLKSITDETQLGQAIMSINNLFTRVPSVKGLKSRRYGYRRYEGDREIERSIGDVVGQRTKEIKNNIDKSELADSLKVSYKNMIDATEKYRKDNPKWYEETKKGTSVLHNGVGINLGNNINIESPMVNPEYIKGLMVDIDELDFEGKEEIEKRALEMMVNNKTLLGTLLQNHKKIDVTKIDVNINIIKNENGKIDFTLNGTPFTLEANVNFGYFPQCVNHMLLLDKILFKVGRLADVSEETPTQSETQIGVETETQTALETTPDKPSEGTDEQGKDNGDWWMDEARKYGYLPDNPEEQGVGELDNPSEEFDGGGEYIIPPVEETSHPDNPENTDKPVDSDEKQKEEDKKKQEQPRQKPRQRLRQKPRQKPRQRPRQKPRQQPRRQEQPREQAGGQRKKILTPTPGGRYHVEVPDKTRVDDTNRRAREVRLPKKPKNTGRGNFRGGSFGGGGAGGSW